MRESTTKQPRLLLLVGRPGAGKGTQATALVSHLNAQAFSVGQRLRDEAQSGTLSSDAVSNMGQGRLAGETVLNRIPLWLMALSRSSQAYIVADGLARTEAEALALTEKIALFREATALVLEVPEWECRRRLQLRGRNDDHESAVTSRMQIYEDQCTAIVETLKRSMETFYIEGIGSQDLVTDRILDVICPDMIDIFKD